MNRLYRLARLDSFIKEAAKKSEDIAALRSIFMEKYPGERAAAGFAVQYYNKFIRVSNPDDPPPNKDILLQQLPDSIEELKDLIRSAEFEDKPSKNSELTAAILSQNPGVELEGFGEDYLVWIHKRYVLGESEKDEVIHPIEDSLPTLRKFLSIQNKVKNTPLLKKKISDAGFEDISSVSKLSLDEMERIISLDDSGLTVQVEGVNIKEGEFLGKFGEWNLWLPHTKETSVKIAGYDPVTYEPETEWCTARTKGSNLFYNYIGREDYAVFLFYIIKDNPVAKSTPNDSDEQKRLDNDWLSLGYVAGNNRYRLDDVDDEDITSELTPDYSGKDGGLTVNRANKGLKEDDFYEILGNQFPRILSRINNEFKKFEIQSITGEKTYQSPGRAIVKRIASDVVEFKKEFKPKSNEEKQDFAHVISGSNPSKEVMREIFKFYYKSDKPKYLALARRGETDGLGIDDLTRSLVEETTSSGNFDLFIDNANLAIKLGMYDFIRQKADLFLEKYPRRFVELYQGNISNPEITEVVKRALISIAKNDPFLYIDRYYVLGDLLKVGDVAGDLARDSLLSLAENDPETYFRRSPVTTPNPGVWISGKLLLITKVAIENFAKMRPEIYLSNSMPYMSLGKKLEMVDELNIIALNSLTNKDPKRYLAFDSKMINKLGLNDQQKIELDKAALQSVAEKDPPSYLSFYIDKGIALGLDAHIIALKKLIELDPTLYPDFYLKITSKYSELAKKYSLEDLTRLAIEKIKILAEQEPNIYIQRYYSSCKRLNMINSFDIGILEKFAIDSPGFFLSNSGVIIAKELSRSDIIITALNRLYETNYEKYLSDPSLLKLTKEFGLADLIRSAMERFLNEKSSYLYLEKCASLARRLGFDDLNIKAMNMFVSSSEYSENLYNKFKLLTGLNDSDLNRGLNEAPLDVEPSPEPQLDDIDSRYHLDNHLIKLSKALDCIGLKEESSKIKTLISS